MDIFKFLSVVLTVLGIFLLLISCLIFLKDGGKVLGIFVENKWYSLAPFLLGMIFLMSGVSMIKRFQK